VGFNLSPGLIRVNHVLVVDKSFEPTLLILFLDIANVEVTLVDVFEMTPIDVWSNVRDGHWHANAGPATHCHRHTAVRMKREGKERQARYFPGKFKKNRKESAQQ